MLGTSLIALSAGPALAQTSVTSPFAGVRHYQRTATVPRALTINVAEFDLTTPGLSFLMTPRTGSGVNESTLRTTTSAVDVYDAQIGINASFYTWSNPDQETEGNGTNGLINRGIVASEGDLYSPFERDRRPWPVFNISEDNIASVVSRIIPPDYPRPRPINSDIEPDIPLYNAVSGSDRIVTDGINTSGDAGVTFGEPLNPRARTGLGLTADNRLLMITIDEGSTASRGATTAELAEVMRQYGVIHGVNLDGGGSTTMVFREEGQNARVVNTLGNTQRTVTTHLMARTGPATEATDTFIYADFLLGDRGNFTLHPTYSGSTTGVDTSSTNTAISAGELGGRGWVQELDIVDDSQQSGGWFVRHLSGSSAVRSQNTPRETTGYVGFWAMTESEGVDIAIAIDDTDNVTADRGLRQSLIADGEWHLYQWNLEDDAQWEAWINGDGIIDTADFTIDSIQLFGGDADAVVYLDDIMHNSLGMIPEPGSLAVAGLAAMGLLVRRRR